MVIPYLLMTFLYLSLAVLAILYSALVNFQVLPPLPNLRWYVVHLAALGTLVEFSFAALPALTTKKHGRPAPAFDWLTWLLLNAGLALLLPGIGWMNFLIITTGGTGIFLAVLRLLRQLYRYKTEAPRPETAGYASEWPRSPSGGLKFYLVGAVFLLLGILVGTGLWQGWAAPLRIAIPKEVHVHANLWGFTALIFAGLLIDFIPRLELGTPAPSRRENLIFWLMSLGALGLVLGPWVDIGWLQVIGLGMHTAGSILLMHSVFRPRLSRWKSWQPGFWHVAAAYVWFFLPVVVAPFVVVRLGVGNEVAGSGGALLIFGWVVQLLSALIPAIWRSIGEQNHELRLGGSWFGLAAYNTGSILYWISLFTPFLRGWLRGLAFLLWLAATLPALVEIIGEITGIEKKVTRRNFARPDPEQPVAEGRKPT